MASRFSTTRSVLYVNASGFISGAERSLLAMIGALADSEWSCTVAAPPGELLNDVQRHGGHPVPVPLSLLYRPRSVRHAWEGWRTVRAGRRQLSQVIEEVQPDIIHANTTTAMLYLPASPCPTVWHVRDLVPLGPLGRWLYRRASRVAVISSAVREDVRRYATDGGRKLRLLPPVVDADHFHPVGDPRPLRETLGLPSDIPLIGCIAQFVPWKRHHLFLDALMHLGERPWHAVLAGATLHADAAYLDSLRRRIAAPPLAGRVSWLPWRADMAPLLAALDILCLTSQREPFGRVLLEALACGVPAVAVHEGGVGDVIHHEENGLLVPADAPALAGALTRLLDAPTWRRTLGYHGRDLVMQSFTLSAERILLQQLYQELLSVK